MPRTPAIAIAIMAISPNIANALLVQCHRRCCVCHKFCGLGMEIHHIVPRKQEVSDERDNLIPLCFDCHAQACSYNVDHPKGRKFRPNELRQHRDQWIEICKTNPGALTSGGVSTEAGPLQSLVGELEFNLTVVRAPEAKYGYVCSAYTRQFERAISEGITPMLPDQVRQDLYDVYHELEKYNCWVRQHEQTVRSSGANVASTLAENIAKGGRIERLLCQLNALLGTVRTDETDLPSEDS